MLAVGLDEVVALFQRVGQHKVSPAVLRLLETVGKGEDGRGLLGGKGAGVGPHLLFVFVKRPHGLEIARLVVEAIDRDIVAQIIDFAHGIAQNGRHTVRQDGAALGVAPRGLKLIFLIGRGAEGEADILSQRSAALTLELSRHRHGIPCVVFHPLMEVDIAVPDALKMPFQGGGDGDGLLKLHRAAARKAQLDAGCRLQHSCFAAWCASMQRRPCSGRQSCAARRPAKKQGYTPCCRAAPPPG